MEPKMLDAVAMVRQIRDAQYEQLKDKSPEEQVRYFRERSLRLIQKLEQASKAQAQKIASKS
jgi:hypothetical protein